MAPVMDKPWFLTRKFNRTLGHPSLDRINFTISRSIPRDTTDAKPTTRGNLILGVILNIAAPRSPSSDPKIVVVITT